MRKTLVTLAASAACLTLLPQRVAAQVELGFTDIGAVIGLGNIGNATVAFGGRFERVFKKLPELGDGLLGIQVSADVYSFSRGAGKFRYVPVGATANYHFKLDPKNKIDLFLGAGLGFSSESCTIPVIATTVDERVVSAQVINAAVRRESDCGGTSGLYFIGRAGGRYFLSKMTSVYADLGAGAATINIGLTRRLR